MSLAMTMPKENLIKEAVPVKDFLKVSDTAKRLGVSAKTITRWIKEGFFPNATRLNPMVKGSPYRIPEGDIKKFEEKRKSPFADQVKDQAKED